MKQPSDKDTKCRFSISEITKSNSMKDDTDNKKEYPDNQRHSDNEKSGMKTKIENTSKTGAKVTSKSNKKYKNKSQDNSLYKIIHSTNKTSKVKDTNNDKGKDNNKNKEIKEIQQMKDTNTTIKGKSNTNKIRKHKLYIKHIGTKRKSTIILWILLLSSMLFGIYKNFTAVNTHTIYEKEIVKQEVIDTNRIENFVRNFAKVYHSWDNNRQSIDKRTKQLSYYLTNQLQILNLDTVRIDIPTSSKVNDIQIWSVIPKKDKKNEYEIIYYVDQSIIENKNTKNVLSSYKVTVHLKEDGNMVIIQNPTICSKPTKSDYEPKPMDIQIIDMQKQEEIEQFLKTFFTLYPKANDKELAYYVKNNALQPVMKNYIFAELLNPIYQQQDNGKIKVYVSVKYLDEDTKMTMICQYELMLEKDDNWMIVG